MLVEAFHQTLKIVYFTHKQKCRLDILINTLLKIARDNAFESLIKKEKGKLTNRVCNINKPHTANKGLLIKGSITTIDACKWRVPSQTNSNIMYTVQNIQVTSWP